MNKEKLSQDFLVAAFILGKELLNKDDLTEAERNFLKYLDMLSELY